jgi:hypothetical protein
MYDSGVYAGEASKQNEDRTSIVMTAYHIIQRRRRAIYMDHLRKHKSKRRSLDSSSTWQEYESCYIRNISGHGCCLVSTHWMTFHRICTGFSTFRSLQWHSKSADLVGCTPCEVDGRQYARFSLQMHWRLYATTRPCRENREVSEMVIERVHELLAQEPGARAQLRILWRTRVQNTRLTSTSSTRGDGAPQIE